MKELLKSKGMILFVLFIMLIAIIDCTTQKNVSAENTNSSNYFVNNSSK